MPARPAGYSDTSLAHVKSTGDWDWLRAEREFHAPLELAWIHFALDRSEHGFRWVVQAAQDRAFELTALKVDPRFDSLRQDRRFATIVKQLGLG
ncbi:MAG: hypothetical protein ACM3SQ_06570 [Betaproteobacteria bacterium]